MGQAKATTLRFIRGILAQRLIRTLCKECKEAYVPTQEEFAELMESYGLEYWDTLGIRYSPQFTLYRPKGCNKCSGGYKGRMGIHELLVATDEMKRKIQKRDPIEELRKQAMRDGMTTLLQDGIQKVIKGITDFKQVGRCASSRRAPAVHCGWPR